MAKALTDADNLRQSTLQAALKITDDAEKVAAAKIAEAQKTVADLMENNKVVLSTANQPSELGKELRDQPGDITIRCADGEVSAHKIILKTFKQSFFNFLSNESWAPKPIDLKQFSSKTVELCLDLMYQAKTSMEMEFEDLCKLYQLTDYLKLDKLNLACVEAIKNALALFKDSKKYMDFYSFINEQMLVSNDILLKHFGEQIEIATRFKRANDGDPVDMNNLAVLYARGSGVKQDKAKAFEWFKKAAENGNAEGMVNLGGCYEIGFGFNKDVKKAFEWAKKAANKGLSEGIKFLSLCYFKGIGISQDNKIAFDLFKIAADKGNYKAMTHLGYCYQNGLGVNKDFHKAFEWYKKGTENGDNIAMYNLGTCYANGEGVKADSKKAFEWYKRAAKNGNIQSMATLGLWYACSSVVIQDREMTKHWYARAEEAKKLGEPIEFIESQRSPLDVAQPHIQSMIDNLVEKHKDRRQLLVLDLSKQLAQYFLDSTNGLKNLRDLVNIAKESMLKREINLPENFHSMVVDESIEHLLSGKVDSSLLKLSNFKGEQLEKLIVKMKEKLITTDNSEIRVAIARQLLKKQAREDIEVKLVINEENKQAYHKVAITVLRDLIDPNSKAFTSHKKLNKELGFLAQLVRMSGPFTAEERDELIPQLIEAISTRRPPMYLRTDKDFAKDRAFKEAGQEIWNSLGLGEFKIEFVQEN